MTCPGFKPRACIYLAALTTESSQLVKLRGEMVKRLITDWWLVWDSNQGHAYNLAALTTESSQCSKSVWPLLSQRLELAMTDSGFEPGACIHDAALTSLTDLTQWLRLQDICMHAPGSDPGQVIKHLAWPMNPIGMLPCTSWTWICSMPIWFRGHARWFITCHLLLRACPDLTKTQALIDPFAKNSVAQTLLLASLPYIQSWSPAQAMYSPEPF